MLISTHEFPTIKALLSKTISLRKKQKLSDLPMLYTHRDICVRLKVNMEKVNDLYSSASR